MKNLKNKIKKIILGISTLLIAVQTKVLAIAPLYAPAAPIEEKSFIDKVFEFVKTFFIPIIAIISLLVGLFVYFIIKRKSKKKKDK